MNINLTPLLVIWTALFTALAFIQNDMSLLWTAAAPWLALLAFGLVVWVVAATAIYTKYRQGATITLTTRKGVREVRRGYDPVWIERR